MRRGYKRKRTRLKLRAKPFLWIFLALNVYLGVTRSGLTSIRRVRVEGAEAWDEKRIEDVMQMVRDVPCLQINPHEVESAVMAEPDVRSASLARSIFGSAVLHVSYRKPVARMGVSRRLALSSDGEIYAAHELPDRLPSVYAPQAVLTPNLSLVGLWEPQRIAFLAEQSENLLSNQQHRILITEPGQVILYIGQGRVVLGNCESLDRKVQVLRDRLNRNSTELSQIAELDLTAPDRPAIRRKSPEGGP
jgi:cell division septal protein FtsQ